MSQQVLTRNHRVYSWQAFAGNIGPANIPVDHIIELDYACQAYSNSTTATTIATLKELCDEVVLNLGGREICRLDNTDVWDLDTLWFGQTPQSFITGADNVILQLEPATIPLSLDKEAGGQLRTLDVQFTFGAQPANTDNPTMFANVPYISNQNVSWLPEGCHYAYQYRNWTSLVTAQEVLFPRKGADCIGLMIFNATPWNTVAAGNDVDWLTIYVNDQPVYGPVFWQTMRTFQGTQTLVDDAVYGTENWNYRYLDFSKAPLPADFLSVAVQGMTATGHTCRLIGVFVEP